MLSQNGYDVLGVRGVPAPFPKAIGDGFLGRLLLGLNSLMIRLGRGLFSYQIFVTARARPTVDELLRRSHVASEDRRRELSTEVEAGVS
jgi:hypothetical protein